MATLAFPKGKTAILIMDCQNDIVHENGKMVAMSNGVMAKLIRERNVLGTIARLAEAGRNAGTNNPCAARVPSGLYRRATEHADSGRNEAERNTEGRHLGCRNPSGREARSE
jgi:hypothetical protein